MQANAKGKSKKLSAKRLSLTIICLLLINMLTFSMSETIVYGSPAWPKGWMYRQTLNIDTTRTVGSGHGFYNYNVTIYNSRYVDPLYQALHSSAVNVLISNIKPFSGYDTIVPHSSAYPIPYCWDAYFSILAALKFNTTLAREIINAEFAAQKSNGMIPNTPSMAADMDLRSQPPLLADAIVRYYYATDDLESLKQWYPKLIAYYNWYEEFGSPEGSIFGLISPFTGRRNSSDGLTAFYIAASTGLDNHPVYDATNGSYVQIGNYYYMSMADLLLSSTMAIFARSLADISQALGIPPNYTLYMNKHSSLVYQINNHLWDDSSSLYKGKLWNGSIIDMNTQLTFIPLAAGIPNAYQASALVKHLTNISEYNLAYGVPTVAANDPRFYSLQPAYFFSADGDYWRGNMWAPLVYLTYVGLKEYGYDNEAREIALKWIETIKKEKDYPFSEYYDPRTGQAGNRLKKFSWTAAVTLLLIEEECMLTESMGPKMVVEDGKVKLDFSDVRFYIGDAQLYYWTETINNNKDATFWFKVPDNWGGQPIHVYYGNPQATWDPIYCSGEKTFLFFEDFIGDSLNLTTWNWLNSDGSYVVSNGTITIINRGSGINESGSEIKSSDYKPSVNSTVETRFFGADLSSDFFRSGQMGLAFTDKSNQSFLSADNTHFIIYDHSFFIQKWLHKSRNESIWQSSHYLFNDVYDSRVVYKIKVFLDFLSVNYSLSDGENNALGSLNGNNDFPRGFAGNYYLGLFAHGGTVSYDYVFVRPTVFGEPSGWIWGQEEEADQIAPTYSNLAHSSTLAGNQTVFSSYWDDNVALSHYIFSTNNTGSWVNDTALAFHATPAWANTTNALKSTIAEVIGYRWYANDTANNWKSTNIQCLITTTIYDEIEPEYTLILSYTPSSLYQGDNVSISILVKRNTKDFNSFLANVTKNGVLLKKNVSSASFTDISLDAASHTYNVTSLYDTIRGKSASFTSQPTVITWQAKNGETPDGSERSPEISEVPFQPTEAILYMFAIVVSVLLASSFVYLLGKKKARDRRFMLNQDGRNEG